jgi:hypothetical protein
MFMRVREIENDLFPLESCDTDDHMKDINEIIDALPADRQAAVSALAAELIEGVYRGRHKEIAKLAVGESWIAEPGCNRVGRARHHVNHLKHGWTIRSAVGQFTRMTGCKFKCWTMASGAIKVTRVS